MKLVFGVLLIIFASGCATVSQSKLYWGNYSKTLYQVKTNPGDESNKAHESELMSIVEKSRDMNLKVPPGVYAELGIYASGRGDKSSAKNYFQLEQEVYPESSVLMSRALDI